MSSRVKSKSVQIFQSTLILLTIPFAVQPVTAQSDSDEKLEKDKIPQARQFDFWIGEWDVFNSAGQLVGTNKIELILNKHVLHEHWEGKSGSNGQSYNIYSKGRWHQTWVDNSGTLLLLDGEFKEDQMVLEGETLTKNGRVEKNQITWKLLDDGRVKQHWRKSGDSGKTWQDVFVGFYKRQSKTRGKPSTGEAPTPDPIQQVLDADAEFGKRRNQGSREASLDATIVKYVADMKGIGLEGCPEPFQKAFAEHIEAWEDSVPFFRQHAEIRGEMHSLFEQIRSLDAQSRTELEAHEKKIWGTWKTIEDISDRQF